MNSAPPDSFSFNPLSPHLRVDPYLDYAHLRHREPVYFCKELGVWILTSYPHVAQFLGEGERLQLQYVSAQTARMGLQVLEEPYFKALRKMIVVLDNPDHDRIRSLFNQAFGPKQISALRSAIERGADEIIDGFIDRREGDLVAEFCFKFPVRVIGDMLGIPAKDHDRIGDIAYALNAVFEWLPMSPDTLQKVNDSVEKLTEYFRELQEYRRREPGPDLFSALVKCADQDKGISDEELISNAILIYIAGHETSAGALSLGLLALHRNPDELQRLRDNPSLVTTAVPELMRYDASGQATGRIAMADIQFGDISIPAGSFVIGYIGAANRDASVYPEPDRLDLGRKPTARLLNFGGGGHFCLGNMLARMELEVAYTHLLRRLPDLQLKTLDPPFRETALMRGVARLDARW
ncbi:MAG: Cytochrome [Hydrocarboniphaga sp.]|uniref:cytochrome P450 n=1 Tax=Hydrocarboniphaga sp. TaxID=2033016 RepID=UPI00262D5D4F|nr:cytochrome P450 [Hydrocarboniphaga sp.]MDB5970169.1 Cytochrome [Hydrocarboniphaga sp.]